MPRKLIAGLIRIITLLPRLFLLGLQKVLRRPSHFARRVGREILRLPAFMFRATRAAVRKVTP